MTEPKWSKGEWEKQPGIPYINCGDEGPCFGPVVMAGTEEEMNADASLMASAKELYKALAALVPDDFGEHPQDFSEEWHKAAAVLREARGETQ